MSKRLNFIENDSFIAELNFIDFFGGYDFTTLKSVFNTKRQALYNHIINNHFDELKNIYNRFMAEREQEILNNIITNNNNTKNKNKI